MMQWLYNQWRWFYLGLVEMRSHWDYFRRKRINVRRRDAHQWLMATCAVAAISGLIRFSPRIFAAAITALHRVL